MPTLGSPLQPALLPLRAARTWSRTIELGLALSAFLQPPRTILTRKAENKERLSYYGYYYHTFVFLSAAMCKKNPRSSDEATDDG